MELMMRGKFALITGASGEIGKATAIEFAREGAAGVVLQYNKNRARVARIAGEMKSLGCTAVPIRSDVSNPVDARKLAREALSRFDRLDVLVCLAGHPFLRDDWFEDFEKLEPEQLRRPLEVDLLGSMYVIQAAIAVMRRQHGGKIVLTGSTPAITGDVVGIPYLVAKAGLLALTKSLAWYLGGSNIHVNALALGAIDTEATLSHMSAQEKRELASESALGRFGTPAEVARKIVFLSGADSDFLTGQILVVDGGYAMR